ncbi:MAG: hypothetical protein OQK81_05170 [Candidatus Bathyarchaeota archaeon]|nr:hypothetical protein [Candidatus Bathyarchaeota archaeon]
MALNLDTLLIQIVVNIIILAPVLWLSARLLVGEKKAKFVDAIWIVVLGTVISTVFNAMFDGIIASIILLVILLGLVKHFFDSDWLKALIISVLAVVLFAVIIALLAVVGIGLGLSLLLL